MSKFADTLKEVRTWVILVASVVVSLGSGTAINANVAEHEAQEVEEHAGQAVSVTLKKLNAHTKALKDMKAKQAALVEQNAKLSKALAELQEDMTKPRSTRRPRPPIIIEEHPAPPPPAAAAEGEGEEAADAGPEDDKADEAIVMEGDDVLDFDAEDAFAELPGDYQQLQQQMQQQMPVKGE